MIDHINIYYQNVRGIRSKTQEVKLNILSNNFDIIILTETWLNDGVYDGEFMDSRYSIYRRDREQRDPNKTKNGGGVMIAVKNNLKSNRKLEWESSCEDLWVEVDINTLSKLNHHIAICAAYLPPPVKKDTLNDFLSNTSQIVSTSKRVLLIGDFNLGGLTF